MGLPPPPARLPGYDAQRMRVPPPPPPGVKSRKKSKRAAGSKDGAGLSPEALRLSRSDGLRPTDAANGDKPADARPAMPRLSFSSADLQSVRQSLTRSPQVSDRKKFSEGGVMGAIVNAMGSMAFSEDSDLDVSDDEWATSRSGTASQQPHHQPQPEVAEPAPSQFNEYIAGGDDSSSVSIADVKEDTEPPPDIGPTKEKADVSQFLSKMFGPKGVEGAHALDEVDELPDLADLGIGHVEIEPLGEEQANGDDVRVERMEEMNPAVDNALAQPKPYIKGDDALAARATADAAAAIILKRTGTKKQAPAVPETTHDAGGDDDLWGYDGRKNATDYNVSTEPARGRGIHVPKDSDSSDRSTDTDDDDTDDSSSSDSDSSDDSSATTTDDETSGDEQIKRSGVDTADDFDQALLTAFDDVIPKKLRKVKSSLYPDATGLDHDSSYDEDAEEDGSKYDTTIDTDNFSDAFGNSDRSGFSGSDLFARGGKKKKHKKKTPREKNESRLTLAQRKAARSRAARRLELRGSASSRSVNNQLLDKILELEDRVVELEQEKSENVVEHLLEGLDIPESSDLIWQKLRPCFDATLEALMEKRTAENAAREEREAVRGRMLHARMDELDHRLTIVSDDSEAVLRRTRILRQEDETLRRSVATVRAMVETAFPEPSEEVPVDTFVTMPQQASSRPGDAGDGPLTHAAGGAPVLEPPQARAGVNGRPPPPIGPKPGSMRASDTSMVIYQARGEVPFAPKCILESIPHIVQQADDPNEVRRLVPSILTKDKVASESLTKEELVHELFLIRQQQENDHKTIQAATEAFGNRVSTVVEAVTEQLVAARHEMSRVEQVMVSMRKAMGVMNERAANAQTTCTTVMKRMDDMEKTRTSEMRKHKDTFKLLEPLASGVHRNDVDVSRALGGSGSHRGLNGSRKLLDAVDASKGMGRVGGSVSGGGVSLPDLEVVMEAYVEPLVQQVHGLTADFDMLRKGTVKKVNVLHGRVGAAHQQVEELASYVEESMEAINKTMKRTRADVKSTMSVQAAWGDQGPAIPIRTLDESDESESSEGGGNSHRDRRKYGERGMVPWRGGGQGAWRKQAPGSRKRGRRSERLAFVEETIGQLVDFVCGGSSSNAVHSAWEAWSGGVSKAKTLMDCLFADLWKRLRVEVADVMGTEVNRAGENLRELVQGVKGDTEQCAKDVNLMASHIKDVWMVQKHADVQLGVVGEAVAGVTSRLDAMDGCGVLSLPQRVTSQTRNHRTHHDPDERHPLDGFVLVDGVWDRSMVRIHNAQELRPGRGQRDRGGGTHDAVRDAASLWDAVVALQKVMQRDFGMIADHVDDVVRNMSHGRRDRQLA